MNGYLYFTIGALIVLLVCLGVVIRIGIWLHKETVKMSRACDRCALQRTEGCPWSNCYLYDGHPYFKKVSRRSFMPEEKRKIFVLDKSAVKNGTHWVEKDFNELHKGDLFKIYDGDTRYTDLNTGDNVWMASSEPFIADGHIAVNYYN